MITRCYQHGFTLIITFLLATSVFLGDLVHAADSECMVLLHGLGRTKLSMGSLETHFSESGYTVWNESYASTKHDIQTLSSMAISPALAHCAAQSSTPIHFITHSLGGILIRHFLQRHSIENLGRIVMISPPNKGSEIIDTLKEIALFKLLLGPVSQQLGTDQGSVPNSLQPVQADIGIIMGTRSAEPWFSEMIEGIDDGKVSITSAKLEEMTDFVTVNYGHTSIMRKAEVIELAESFIRSGKFPDPQ